MLRCSQIYWLLWNINTSCIYVSFILSRGCSLWSVKENIGYLQVLSTLPQNLFNSWQVSLSEHGVSESCRSCRHIQNTKILKTKQKKISVTKCYDLSNAIWRTDLVSLLRKSRSGREKLIRDRDDLKSSSLAWLCLHGNHCLAEEQCVADVWVFCLFIFCFWKQHL